MPSVFDPVHQQQDTDSKLVAALERLAHAFHTLLWDTATRYGLTPGQIQLLIYLYTHPEDRNSMRVLATWMQVRPPTLTEMVKALERKELLRRERDPEDRRVKRLVLTASGTSMARELLSWADPLRPLLPGTPDEKAAILDYLLRLIANLYRAGVISVARTCRTCRYFVPDAAPQTDHPHFCRLLEKPLGLHDLRVDCPEYAAA